MRLAFVVVLVLAAHAAEAQEVRPVTEVAPAQLAADTPVLEHPQPLIINADGSMPEGRSVRVAAGQPAPYSGQLIDDQELTRRGRVNRAQELELAKAKQGKVLLPTPAFIAIVVGVAVVVAAASVGVYEVARPKPPPP